MHESAPLDDTHAREQQTTHAPGVGSAHAVPPTRTVCMAGRVQAAHTCPAHGQTLTCHDPARRCDVGGRVLKRLRAAAVLLAHLFAERQANLMVDGCRCCLGELTAA
jgi:hypothetical protein